MLEQEDYGRPAYVEFISGFRPTLAAGLNGKTTIYTENLDLARFDNPGYRQELETWLRTKYRGRNLDAIVAIGKPSVDFALSLRTDMGRAIPIIHTAVMAPQAQPLAALPATTGVTLEVDTRGTLEAAMRLCPDTQRIAFVCSERGYTEIFRQVRNDVESFAAHRYEFTSLTNLTFAELKQALAALPPRTIVYYFSYSMDSTGQVFNPRDALQELSRVSARPIFSSSDSYLGFGTVGGSCMRFARLGAEVANQTATVLAAPPGAAVPVRLSACNGLLFDWAELTRRGIDPRLVPPGSEVRFRPATLWEEHRGTVIVVIGALLLQSGLIAALIGQRLRRRRAERALLAQREQLAHASRVSQMGQLAASLAHELSQPLGAILRNAEAAELLLRNEPPDLAELRTIVADIQQDDQRAGQVIERMRALLKRRTVEAQLLSLDDVVERVTALVRSDALARQVAIETEPGENVPPVLADRIHLKQVLLNLLLNGMDAVKDSAQRRVRVRTRSLDAKTVEVAVDDSGAGIPADQLSRVFDPFFTTKPNGMGLGLAISRTIIEAHGGRLTCANNPAGGATFRFTLPAGKPAAP